MERDTVELGSVRYDCEIVRPDLEDQKTWDMLRNSDALGCFQIETSSFLTILPGYQVSNLPDLSALIGLYRPGGLQSGGFQQYLDRKSGRAKVEYDHPKLEPVLRETYGVLVFQEQVIQATMVLANYSEAKADLFRKAIGKMKREILDAEEAPFIEGCMMHSEMTREAAKAMFDKLAAFASYSFNKSHSVSYAIVCYQMSWLKANYFIEFMCAVLNFEGQGPRMKKYIDNCKQHGVSMLPPDCNESISGVVIGRTRSGTEGLRIGLGKIKGVGAKAVETIEKNRPYTSFTEFLNKIDRKACHSGCLKALIEAGVFDTLGYTRKALSTLLTSVTTHKYPKETIDAQLSREFNLPIDAIERARDEIKKKYQETKERATPTKVRQDLEQMFSGYNDFLITKRRKELDVTLSDESIEKLLREYTEEFTSLEMAQREIELLGLFISIHPLEAKRERIAHINPISLEQLDKYEEGTFSIVIAIENVEYNPDRGRYDLEVSDLSAHGFASLWSNTPPALKVGDCVAMRVNKSRWGLNVKAFQAI
jgi:DNA polymerase III alpha subunit